MKEIDGEIQDLKTDEKKEADYMTFQMLLDEEREEGFAEGTEKGMEKGRLRTILANVRALMKKTGWTANETLEALDIAPDDRGPSPHIYDPFGERGNKNRKADGERLCG